MADAKLYQVVLNAPGCSGRAVRYRRLSMTEHDNVARAIMGRVTNETTKLDFRVLELNEGARQIVVAYTREAAPPPDVEGGKVVKSQAEKLRDPSLWVTDRMALALPGAWESVFNTKDTSVLCAIYERNHDARPEEVDAILGKAEEVSL